MELSSETSTVFGMDLQSMVEELYTWTEPYG